MYWQITAFRYFPRFNLHRGRGVCLTFAPRREPSSQQISQKQGTRQAYLHPSCKHPCRESPAHTWAAALAPAGRLGTSVPPGARHSRDVLRGGLQRADRCFGEQEYATTGFFFPPPQIPYLHAKLEQGRERKKTPKNSRLQPRPLLAAQEPQQ